jgi:ADP-heptose:LPS heptosyltransferase
MSIFRQINNARQILMRRITRPLGQTRITGRVDGNVAINRVLICRPNHRLGNQLLMTPLLQELENVLPQAKVDLLVKGSIAPIIFKNYRNVDQIIRLPKKPMKELFSFLTAWASIRRRHYDIVINVVFNSSSGRISAQMANATYRFLGDIDSSIPLRYRDHEHMAKFPVYSFRFFMNKLGLTAPDLPVPPLDLKLDAGELAEGKSILNDIVKNERRTIAIYTYATGHKCYAQDWWLNFYRLLKENFPAYNLIEVLPIENVSQISFQAPAYYSKELRKIGGLIANTDLFIGADSGMMHLASASRTPVLGLFKSENIGTYEPYNEGSVGVNTDKVTNEECVRIIGQLLAARNLVHRRSHVE